MKPHLAYLPIAGLYGAGVAVRNLLFDVGVFRPEKVGVPVISVGNIRAGGTGKTPFVILVAEMLSERGLRPGVVSRGYGRSGNERVVVGDVSDARTVGDEPAMLAPRIPGPVVVAASKREAARWVAAEGLADVIILDDGFQHRWLGRDVDIVLVRAEDLPRKEWLLPAGYAREPRGALTRADCVVVTGCQISDDYETARRHLASLRDTPIIGVRVVADEVVDVVTQEPVELLGSRVVAFSGIGNPTSFERTLGELGADLVAVRVFRDHHWYTDDDLQAIGAEAKLLGAERIVTTEKDYVRLRAAHVASLPALSVVKVRHEIIAGLESLRAQFDGIVKRTKGQGARDAHWNER